MASQARPSSVPRKCKAKNPFTQPGYRAARRTGQARYGEPLEDLKAFADLPISHLTKRGVSGSNEISTMFYKKCLDPKGKGKERGIPFDIDGYTDEVLALTVSNNGQYLASAGKDEKLGIWDAEKNKWVEGFG
ncbi:hypothetical protein V8E55_005219 [Tylopilus felleus]